MNTTAIISRSNEIRMAILVYVDYIQKDGKKMPSNTVTLLCTNFIYSKRDRALDILVGDWVNAVTIDDTNAKINVFLRTMNALRLS